MFDEAAGAAATVAGSSQGLGLLRRSLLWFRPPSAASLVRIGRGGAGGGMPVQVPSWSWMAYMGEIDYLALKFGSIDWEDLRSPWSSSSSSSSSQPPPAATTRSDGALATLGAELSATVRTVIATPRSDGSASRRRLYFDVLEGSAPAAWRAGEGLECVVLGVEQLDADNMWPLTERLHYVLLVAPTAGLGERDGGKVYKRVGAGCLPGNALSEKGEWIVIR